jgi:hypothetical protein
MSHAAATWRLTEQLREDQLPMVDDYRLSLYLLALSYLIFAWLRLTTGHVHRLVGLGEKPL